MDSQDDSNKTDEDAVLERAKDFYAQASETEDKNRQRFIDDMRFARLGEQWPDAVRQDRETEGRPCLTFNKLTAFIRQVVNDSRQNKPGINVIPVGSDSDKDSAEILDGLIRNIEAVSNADTAYDVAIENAVSGGWGYLRVKVDYATNDAFELDICIEQVNNPLNVYGDFNSDKSDSSDWDQCLIVDWVKQSEFEDKYPDADKVDWEHDYETSREWVNESDVLVAEYWEREEKPKTIYLLSSGMVVDDKYLEDNEQGMELSGISVVSERETIENVVTQYLLTGAEILEENEFPCQFIPVIPVYGDEVNEDGERHFYSLHHQARSAQESYNYWRTSAVEKVALDTKAPWIGPVGAFNTDADKWATANSQNHAFIEYDGMTPPGRGQSGGVPAGDINMALSAADDMKSIIGIYDASLGAKSNETSGRAIMARQREGDTATFHFIDNMSRAIRHTGKIIVDLIPNIYNKERIVRILHEDGTPEEVQINKEFLQEGVPRIYDLTTGKYDVTVKAGPSFTSRREESAEQMMQLIQAFPQAAPLIGDLIAKNLEWPGADDIAKRLKSMLPPQVQGEQQIPPEIQQQIEGFQKQLQQVQGMAQQGQVEMQKLQQENDKLNLQLANKQGDLALKQEEMGLKREELKLKEREINIDQAETSAELQIKAAELAQRSVDVNIDVEKIN